MAQHRHVASVVAAKAGPTENAESLQARLQKVQPNRSKKRKLRTVTTTGQPLNASEAELLGKLAPLLAKRPRRPVDTTLNCDVTIRPDSELTQRLARAIYDAPVVPHDIPPPPTLPEMVEDQTGVDRALPRAVAWVQRSRRARLKRGIIYVAAWLLTGCIVTTIVGGAGVALIGIDKSRDLATRAHAAITNLSITFSRQSH